MWQVLILLALLILAATLLGTLAVRLHLTDFAGYIFAGYLLGPNCLNWIGGPDPQAVGTPAFWHAISDLGVAALMISSGISMPMQLPHKSWRQILIMALAISACLVPAIATAPLLADLALDPAGNTSPRAAIAYRCVLALAVIVTSVPFLTKILSSTGLIATPFGGIVLRAACLVDLVVWSVFPLIVQMRDGTATSAAWAAGPFAAFSMFVAASGLVRLRASLARRVPRCEPVLTMLFTALLGALCAGAMAWLGVSVMLAALAFGLGLSALGLPGGGAGGLVGRVVSLGLIPAYFALIGAQLDLNRDLIVELVVGFLLWSSILKMAAIFAAACLAGSGPADAAIFAVTLNTRGGPGIVLASLAIGAHLISGPTFLAFVVASIGTSIAAEMYLRQVLRSNNRSRKSVALFSVVPGRTLDSA
jgi:Kef-type K+ transport system membrane component KefB